MNIVKYQIRICLDFLSFHVHLSVEQNLINLIPELLHNFSSPQTGKLTVSCNFLAKTWFLILEPAWAWYGSQVSQVMRPFIQGAKILISDFSLLEEVLGHKIYCSLWTCKTLCFKRVPQLYWALKLKEKKGLKEEGVMVQEINIVE